MRDRIETRTIDIGGLFTSLTESPSALDRCIADALRDEGCFLATGFPGAADLQARMNRLLSFFSLSEGSKAPLAIQKYRTVSANLYRGYYPLPTGPHWSYNEIFDIGPEPPLAAPDLRGAAAFREPNVWPPEAILPGWRQAMLDFSGDCRALGLTVVGAAARGLGLDPDAVLEPCLGRNGTLRLLHYTTVPPGFELRDRDGRPLDSELDGRRILARQHVDTGLLSVLWQDQRGGLQVEGRDGIWRDVPVLPGSLSVHCGDLLAGLSGGALRATPHRVLGDNGERYSAGLFLEPDFTTEVLPPEGRLRKPYAAHLIDEFPNRFEATGATDSPEA